jgi:hypothetical protein
VSEWIEVKNFKKLQHYRERRPPWIKLYGSLFDDFEFTELSDASKLLLIGLGILASRTENRIPNKPKWIRDCLHLSEKCDLAPLLKAGFIFIRSEDASTPASMPPAERKQNLMPETERETEKRESRGREEREIAHAILESLGSSHEQPSNVRAIA